MTKTVVIEQSPPTSPKVMKTPPGDEKHVPTKKDDKNSGDEQSSPTSPNIMKTPPGDEKEVRILRR